MEYKIIYPFNVYEMIKAGHTVYMLDRAELSVSEVNNLNVRDWVAVFALSEKEPNHFEFWVETEKENNTNE